VLSFNDPAGTAGVIRSARNQDYACCDVVNVENGTSAASREATRLAFPDVVTLDSPVNLGFGGGNNLALEHAVRLGYDAVLLCNDDVVLEPNTVRLLAEAEESLPDAAIIGGVEWEDGSEKILSAGGRLRWWMGRVVWNRSVPTGSRNPIPVFCAQGALLYFTGRGLQAGLRLDASLGLYCEEMELGYALRALGLRAYLHPGVTYRHRSGGNRRARGLNSRNAYYIARNRVWVSRKHLSRPRFALFVMFYALELLLKAPLRAVNAPAGFARNLIRGACDGLRATRVESLPL
jgi:hypothetical protein